METEVRGMLVKTSGEPGRLLDCLLGSSGERSRGRKHPVPLFLA